MELHSWADPYKGPNSHAVYQNTKDLCVSFVKEKKKSDKKKWQTQFS